jgi:uncharacterized protein with PhoU and TrkA domain
LRPSFLLTVNIVPHPRVQIALKIRSETVKRVFAIALAVVVALSLAVETQARVVRVRRGPAAAFG